MKFHIPIKLPSLANERMHWRQTARIKRKQRIATSVCMRRASSGTTCTDVVRPPLVVTITRVGPRKLDDDNLASACKYVRDEIARIIGTDDGSPLYTWRYAQCRGGYGVDVEITPRLTPA